MEILLLWRNKDEWRLWKFSSNRWSDVATSRMCCDWKGGGRVLLITFLRFVCSSSTCRAVCSKNFYIFLSPSIFFSLKRKVLRLISYRNGKYIYIHGDMRFYRIIESHTGFIYIYSSVIVALIEMHDGYPYKKQQLQILARSYRLKPSVYFMQYNVRH